MSVAEQLTTGWEPNVDRSDTLLRRYLFHWGATTEAWAAAAGGRGLRTPGYIVADYGRPSGYFNAATLLQPLSPVDGERTIDEIDRFFASGTGSYELWSAWPTPDLRTRGWRLEGHPPLLVRPPAAVAPPPSPPAVDARLVTTPETLRHWEQVAIEAYPFDELLPYRPGRLAHPRVLDDARIEAWVGYRNGEPVSIGTMFTEPDLASFTLGTTRPDARRSGFWLRHAVDRLLTAPDRWFAGIFSDNSRPGAEALGFVPINRFTLWTKTRN